VFKNKDDGEDRALLSPFEFEGDADKTPKKVYVYGCRLCSIWC
jgi:hypothetical protein